jgi:hypothetical protein
VRRGPVVTTRSNVTAASARPAATRLRTPLVGEHDVEWPPKRAGLKNTHNGAKPGSFKPGHNSETSDAFRRGPTGCRVGQ